MLLAEFQLSKHDVMRLCSGVNTKVLSQTDSYPLKRHLRSVTLYEVRLEAVEGSLDKSGGYKAGKLWDTPLS